MHRTLLAALAALVATLAGPAWSANTPCSGKKGGISHCMGRYFVCNDESTSQSKKDCQTTFVNDGDSGNTGSGKAKSKGRSR